MDEQPQPLSHLPLPLVGAPATRALYAAGIQWLEQLPAWSERDLLRLHGVGPKAVRILKEALATYGLALRPS
jgi:DNA-directed RNA polymerase alpha subunit